MRPASATERAGSWRKGGMVLEWGLRKLSAINHARKDHPQTEERRFSSLWTLEGDGRGSMMIKSL